MFLNTMNDICNILKSYLKELQNTKTWNIFKDKIKEYILQIKEKVEASTTTAATDTATAAATFSDIAATSAATTVIASTSLLCKK